MATATVLAPSSHYPQSSSYSSYPQHQPGTAPPPTQSSNSGGNMISSEHRRPSDDKEQSGRQSLPSISEVISGTRPGQFPPAQPTGSSLPSPFVPTPRSYSEAEKQSPQQLHTSSTYPPRQENLPAFVDSPRPPFNGRHSLPPVTDRRQTPTKPEFPQHRLAESQQQSDPHASNGAYGHPPPPTSHPYPSGHLPPGQVPLPTYPVSPRHAVPPPPGSYDPRGQSVRHEDAEYSNRPRFESAPARHFETWSYQDALSRIGSNSRIIFTFAEAYGRIAQEQHGSHPIPERLPTEREVNDMLGHIDTIKRSLEQVKDVVQASIQSERAREGTKIKGAYEEEHQDVPMYDNGMKAQYAMTEVKKRRGVSDLYPDAPPRLVDVIVAIGSIPPSGDEDLMVRGPYAMLVGFTTRSSRENASSKPDPSAQSPKREVSSRGDHRLWSPGSLSREHQFSMLTVSSTTR
ncbi:GATA-type sexual development transcription factor NsdD [Metarhizium rileyi]|uniref:GATA-type sexual development transcription factor NsdD n=1 Tax=Metarhizium rileyi (strain RCEF 4871) TaxID=1649241 RepID=A0A167FSQ2_METRR|nr:GATA-type sexual development transcription factor NsdD [Metarhizium rileyi RCEF 4871]